VRVLIVGAGAIGRFMAARLKLAGHNAVLLARPDGAAQLAAGFTFAADGKQYKIAVPVATAPDDAALHDPFELAVMAVKSFSTPGAIESVRAVSACERATMLTLQNGIGNEELCAAAFGDERVVAGALTTAVDKAADGSIVASSKGGLSIAPLGKLPHNWLLAVFENSAIKVAAAPDWRALKWSKLCINLQANAVCAVLDWTPEQVYADKTAFSIERRCLLEAFAVMSALGITPIALIDFPVPLLIAAARTLPEAMLRPVLASRVAKARGGKLPSLLIDARAHRPRTEVDVLNGAVAERAAAAGVAAPANAAVARILNGITDGSIDWDTFRAKPAALAAKIDGALAP
jgi:2-dehydropantoate 2-reductase